MWAIKCPFERPLAALKGDSNGTGYIKDLSDVRIDIFYIFHCSLGDWPAPEKYKKNFGCLTVAWGRRKKVWKLS